MCHFGIEKYINPPLHFYFGTTGVMNLFLSSSHFVFNSDTDKLGYLLKK